MSHISLKSAQNSLLNEMGGQFKDRMSNFGKLIFFSANRTFPGKVSHRDLGKVSPPYFFLKTILSAIGYKL